MADEPMPLQIHSPLASLPHMSPTLTPGDPGTPPPNTPPAMSPHASEQRVFWVSPPALDPEEKLEYKELPAGVFGAGGTDDEDETPVQILGEIRLGTDLYYWVARENEVVYRCHAKDFHDSHPALVDAYNEHKEAGTLENFDSKSARIHPRDRIQMKIFIPARKAKPGQGRTTRAGPSRDAKNKVVIIDASDGDDSEDTSEDDADDFVNKGKKPQEPTRRSARAAATTNQANYRDTSESPVKKRSNPKRRTAAKNDEDYNDEDSSDEEFDEFDAEEEAPKPKQKKVVRGRLSRPAYGNIRQVADLSDDDTDEENAPLHAHRGTCEKCEKAPAHELLMKYYKRGKKKGRPKKANTSDDFEDEEDEEAGLLDLGGWVRCLKCCVTAHWKCLAATQRDEIIKAARAKDKEAEAAGLMPRKRDALEAYDTTEFICGACIKGGICMFCQETAVEAEPLPDKKPDTAAEAQTKGDVAPKLETSDEAPPAKGTPPTDEQKRTPPPAIVVLDPTPRKDGDAAVPDASSSDNLEASKAPRDPTPPSAGSQESLFRCITCKRLAHYAHLPQPDSSDVLTPVELARYYQTENEWKCSDCVSFIHPLDKILAWRPYPANAVEESRRPGELPNHKARLPREYLVKWVERSYRRIQWVPHLWLLSTNAPKLKNFIATGPKVQLLEAPIEDDGDEIKNNDTLTVGEPTKETNPSFLIVQDNSRDPSAQPGSAEEQGPPAALPDAERRIPKAWRRVDRVLDVRLWDPAKRKRALRHKKSKARKKSGKGKRKRADSDESGSGTDDEDDVDSDAEAERLAAREQGEEPSEDLLETVEEWEDRTGEAFSVQQAELVIWAFLKWDELAYEEATWDSPPSPSDVDYADFEKAIQRFIQSRTVFVRKKDKREAKAFDGRRKGLFEQKGLALTTDPDLGQDAKMKLMDFQLKGVNWLFRNWWRHQPSILADEMGLGKTVQIASLVGHLTDVYEAFPVLVVVPNSTITNWLREFAIWAPRLRVVPLSGEGKSREIIRNYELYHDSAPKNYTNLKFHVLVTTYETLIGKDFTPVFKSVPRWELLIIDEGQRLKSDASLLFKRLNELHTVHRILMTGTPLNNNIRELFNLMNFLDPENWNNLDDLEKKYETLTEELLNELHEALKPYFLRRTKADVLTLPPKNEVIVPMSMTAIQKEVYKSILSQNMDILGSLAQPSSRVNNAVKKSNLNNLLMQLRKCLQHPYLVSGELEPTGPGLSPSEVHQNLLAASTKLRFLHSMLPILKKRNHRVLLFSQFVIALDIIEDFLVGEGYKFLRLDGNTKQAQRQKDMDTFNRPDSDVFIYLLSTRAGGVGINLWSADTVIIFDPDFNPHQDLQAISRAHRFGQKKPVLVFKLMVKGAAEERIVQTGKKKLALDHLIVQKMDDDGATDDVQSILTYGAKAIFEGSESHDITYTDADIENLIVRTEKEGDEVPEAEAEAAKAQLSFGFAKLWVVEKDAMEEIAEDAPADAQNDGFWGDVLARAAEEKAKAKAAEVTGRGAKRRAAVSQKYTFDEDSPAKPKAKRRRKSTGDSDVEYNASDVGSSASRSGPSTMDTVMLSDEERIMENPGNKNPFLESSTLASSPIPDKPRLKYKPALAPIENREPIYEFEESDDERPCGLCGGSHAPGFCFMTQNPANLVEYRSMLITESNEPVEMRRGAVQAIDNHLASRGLSHLIKNQPAGFTAQGDIEPPRKKKAHKSKHGESLKRPASPNASSAPKKKAKQSGDMASTCVICGRGPVHLAKACPVVKRGPESIKEAISRLEQDPQKASTVNVLRSLLPNASGSKLVSGSSSSKAPLAGIGTRVQPTLDSLED